MREQIYLRLFGAGDRDRTGDIQLGKVSIAFIINNLQKQQSAKIDARGLKGILTAGAKKGFHPKNTRVSACSFGTPFSTPLEHREAVRTTRGRIVRLGKRTGYRLNSCIYGLLKVFISPLLAGPQGRCQLWARNPTKSRTWWPTFLGVDGFHEVNDVSGIYPGWRGSGRQLPIVRCASARIDTRRFSVNPEFHPAT